MKIKDGFIIRQVGGEHVVVPVGERSKEFHGMINMNQTGAFLWRFFSEEHTVAEGVDALCGEYQVDRERAETDVKQFIEILQRNGFTE
ncbi:MAG: PqqD family protein [Clostridia bacterium]|nr:PqqD family protein [Clostridia bacterium]